MYCALHLPSRNCESSSRVSAFVRDDANSHVLLHSLHETCHSAANRLGASKISFLDLVLTCSCEPLQAGGELGLHWVKTVFYLLQLQNWLLYIPPELPLGDSDGCAV
jgi:hypothetical protein